MEIRSLNQLRDLSSLSRSIFQADVPEEAIMALPAQTLYQVIRYNGLESSIELIETASVEQIRLLLDFDLWNPEGIEEENLWNWLELSSEDDELRILQKVIGSLDLKIVALLIHRYLEVQQNEEPTDMAPGPLFFTPDKGLTWIRVLCEDQRKHFLMSKLLAFLFESNTDIFYQLLATKALSTPAVIEEEAFIDRTKRLAAEGMPDLQFASEVTAFLSITEGLKAISEQPQSFKNQEVVIVEALARLSDSIEPLSSALNSVSNLEESLSEMTLIINAVIVRFKINLSDNDRLLFIANQTHGALNLGLDILSRRSGVDSSEIIARTGLQVAFRVGLTQILDIAKTARRYQKSLLDQGIDIEQSTQALIDLLELPFPCLPATLSHHKNDYAISDNEPLSARPEPFRFFSEIETIKEKMKINS